jgi:hypothetical protein
MLMFLAIMAAEHFLDPLAVSIILILLILNTVSTADVRLSILLLSLA